MAPATAGKNRRATVASLTPATTEPVRASGFARASETEFRNVTRIVEEAFRQADHVTEQAAKANNDINERMALLADAIRCAELGLHYLRVLAGGPPPF
jgi:hypothetical protein